MCGDGLRSGYWREGLYSLFMRRNSCAAPLRQFALPLSLKLGGTSFNTQNPIPHKSQKTKGFLETSRAKEFQRGTAQAEERAKEGGKVPAEGSDTHLGARCREFESPHSDHVGASFVSLAPTFLQKSERTHAAAHPFQITTAALGCDLVSPLRGVF